MTCDRTVGMISRESIDMIGPPTRDIYIKILTMFPIRANRIDKSV